MRTVVLRVVALAVLLFLVLSAVLVLQTMRRLPDTVVYFVHSEPTHFELQRVGRRHRTVSPEDHATVVVAELAAGPSEAERERGLSSAVPEDVKVLSARNQEGILHIDLSEEFEEGGGSAQMQARLHQLFYSLTQPESIDGVVLSVGGDRVELFSGEGIIVDSPWLRSEHTELPVW